VGEGSTVVVAVAGGIPLGRIDVKQFIISNFMQSEYPIFIELEQSYLCLLLNIL